ncbi:hypothetical protein DOM22_10515 [Bdellovibrio sp. ZAP7]|uniref:hypothetical protein n=1 Tax=Bdellovibrio sp. ZAP7 TaxID=2231053 RepID=UPI00115BD2F5|nr:hypothetical protein [Bdellovibrio sp. ZAP7]QDK45551.1 hypothetical protein DOM22_10515 [Bdellovibrio sp. ZAP7]
MNKKFALLLMANLLIASAASASVKYAKVCNLEATPVEFSVKGKTLIVKTAEGKDSFKIASVHEASRKDLREADWFPEVRLTAATIYVLDSGIGIILAVDKDGIQHTLSDFGDHGDSKSCK